jgi:hypothetical protein
LSIEAFMNQFMGWKNDELHVTPTRSKAIIVWKWPRSGKCKVQAAQGRLPTMWDYQKIDRSPHTSASECFYWQNKIFPCTNASNCQSFGYSQTWNFQICHRLIDFGGRVGP